MMGGTNNQMLFMFNFNTVGSGEVYYFDDIQLGDGTEPGLSIEANDLLIGISVFPNPTANSWTIANANQADFNIQIKDVQGKLVSSLNSNRQASISIDSANFPAGVYFLEITSANQTKTIKLVKE
jgi:hypothetical protein